MSKLLDTGAPSPHTGTPAAIDMDGDKLAALMALEKKILWLSAWIIHHANHIRPNRSGIKVGGHQASSASIVTLMTALYMDVLRPEDRVAVKPHASPVFHAIQYLLGQQTLDKLQNFRSFGGAQSYPSRTKDSDDVDFSTGSVGLGVAVTLFASLVQDYLRLKKRGTSQRHAGRMVALVGDAELDEGNIYEAILEGWKHDIRNVWWVIDYNRQSLDAFVPDLMVRRILDLFRGMNWNVIELKYGKQLQQAFEAPGGDSLRDWVDNCPNDLYSALTFQGGGAWREHLSRDLKGVSGIRGLLDDYSDDGLSRLMTNLGGHDMEAVLDAFHNVTDDAPTCFLAYTVKGYGLPFAGHKDNHGGLMNPDQMAAFKTQMGIADGAEWDRFAGLDLPAESLEAFLETVPFRTDQPRRPTAPRIEIPGRLPCPTVKKGSTQEGFGRILNEIAREKSPFADAIVTSSPDVTVTTNLGAWVNRRGRFDRARHDDTFQTERVVSAQKWGASPEGQHLELGIAENNLFLLLAALGLSGELFGTRLLPIGALYDPFIARGLDSLNYACYQDSRFMLISTPSGISLAPEGGAHQSVYTPLIGMGQEGLTLFEPAYVDELAEVMRWSFEHMQEDDGGSVYLRLSTRPLDQPARDIDAIRDDLLKGAYWRVPPGDGADTALVYSGAVAPEVMAAAEALAGDIPGLGILAVTSPDRLYADWRRARLTGTQSHIQSLLAPLAQGAGLLTVLDGFPLTLSWLGSVGPYRVHPLGVDRFGQSGDIPDLYHYYGLDTDAILDGVAALILETP